MDNIFIYELMAVVFSALIAFILTPIVRVLAFRVKALDVPDKTRHLHPDITPTLGGLAIFISFVVNVLIFCDLNRETTVHLAGTVVIVAVGVLDDIFQLNAWVKLAGEIVAAAVPIAFGLRIEFLTFFGVTVNLGVLSIPITLFWILLLTNSINLIDGMDGLACGVSSIAATAILVCSLILSQSNVALLMGILAGSCLGFLPFNLNPARIFMGDTGALSLGYVFSVVSVMGLYKFSTAITFIIPIIIFGLPFGDTFSAIFRRIKHHKGIFQGDHDHFHHKLQALGFSQKQAVIILYAISAVLGISAVFFTLHDWTVGVCILTFTALAGYINMLIFKGSDITRAQTGLGLSYMERPPKKQKHKQETDDQDPGPSQEENK